MDSARTISPYWVTRVALSHSVPHDNTHIKHIATDPSMSDTLPYGCTITPTQPPSHTGVGQVGTWLYRIKGGMGGWRHQPPQGIAHLLGLASPTCLLPLCSLQRGWFEAISPPCGALLRRARWFLECGPRLWRGLGSQDFRPWLGSGVWSGAWSPCLPLLL